MREQVDACLTSRKRHGHLLHAEPHQGALQLGSWRGRERLGATPGVRFLWAWWEDLPHGHRASGSALCLPVVPVWRHRVLLVPQECDPACALVDIPGEEVW